jgi:hypothetical protein
MKLFDVTRNAACNAVVDLVDLSGAGTLRFETSSGVPVATLAFSNIAFGSAATGTATANAITPDSKAAGGTVSKASVYSGTTKLWENTVGTSGAEINLSTLSIPVGAKVAISSLTITMPAN